MRVIELHAALDLRQAIALIPEEITTGSSFQSALYDARANAYAFRERVVPNAVAGGW